LALISDWEAKVETLASACRGEDIRVISGTPSWLLIFFERLRALQPGSQGSLADVFPNLELLVHGGVNFAPYRHQFAELLRAEMRNFARSIQQARASLQSRTGALAKGCV
jgi:hypothetical protein